MGFDRRRRETIPADIPADQPIPNSQRRTFLDVLRMELEQTYGLGSGVVWRERHLVLFVVALKPRAGSVEIGCDLQKDGWWFTLPADDGRTIAPVADISSTAKVVAAELGVTAKAGRGHAGPAPSGDSGLLRRSSAASMPKRDPHDDCPETN